MTKPITLKPGLVTCPFCDHFGRIIDITTERTEHDAGGKVYWWSSFVGHARCSKCRKRWLEQVS